VLQTPGSWQEPLHHSWHCSAQTASAWLAAGLTPCALAGAPAPFMVVAGRLCEANLFRLPHAAWLAGERVLSDGGLVLVTPVDPLFLALPLLEAARRQARPVCITLSGFPCIMEHPLIFPALDTPSDPCSLRCRC